MRSDARFAEPSRVAVAFHVYYPDLFREVLEYLRNIPVPFDLLITDATDLDVELDPRAVANEHLRNAVVLPIENRGRDIYPTMALVNADLLNPYDIVLKVHTKKSVWRADHDLSGDGDSWRRELLDSLMGDEAQVKRILATFATDPSIGQITAPGSVLGPEYWGDNQAITATLLQRLELDLDEPSLIFAAGSMYWTRGFILQGLRGLGITRDDFPEEMGQVNQTTAHGVERLIGAVTGAAGLAIREASEIYPARSEAWQVFKYDRELNPPVDVVPFFLPQFHEVAENSQWWGPGFTEWTNVAAGRPVYLGHHQPKLPRDLGYYDLDSPWVMPRQESLARQYGIAAFMYYHYWFAGEGILGEPLRNRAARTGSLPFCLMWANENWTRRWDGGDDDLLMYQDYDAVPATEFMQSIVEYLRHPDYFRVAGRAVVAVYKPGVIPDIRKVVTDWRALAKDQGIGELLLLAVDTGAPIGGLAGDPRDVGFDAYMGFPPHSLQWTIRPRGPLQARPGFLGEVLEYPGMVESSLQKLAGPAGEYLLPGIMVNFDNTARRPNSSHLWYGANPYAFRRWLAGLISQLMTRPRSERVVFVNAWNEWAEGAVLEPTDKYGLAYLQAVRDVLTSLPQDDQD